MRDDELAELAEEVRDLIIGTVSKTGGHLAANLGVVELTIALLRVFDPPQDKILWDVSHQTYAYKILTGRRDRFAGPVHHRRGRGVGDQPLPAPLGRRHPPDIGISSRR